MDDISGGESCRPMQAEREPGRGGPHRHRHWFVTEEDSRELEKIDNGLHLLQFLLGLENRVRFLKASHEHLLEEETQLKVAFEETSVLLHKLIKKHKMKILRTLRPLAERKDD